MAVILQETFFINLIFSVFLRKRPYLFPVKVTAKKNGKKVSKTLTSNITVKNYKVRLVDANNATVSGTAIAVIGTPVQFTAKTAPAKATVTYTSSDETIATVDATGKVTPVKAGKVTITAATDKATTSVEVEVKTYSLQSVKQTKTTALETVILGKTSDIKPADIKITNTANNNAIAVKSVSVDKTDATKVTVETFADMKDAAKYNVELDGTVKDFTATDGVVSDVNVTPVTIPANTTGTEIKGQTVDKNGIIISEFNATDASKYNAELTLSTTQGYLTENNTKLVLPTVGNKGTAEVKYHTYKFDTNGNEIGAYTKKVDITAVAENAVATTGFNMTFADKGKGTNIKWDKDTLTTQLAIGSNKDAYFQFKNSEGKEITNYNEYSVVSSDDSILLLPKTPLKDSKTGVQVQGIKAGSAFVNVLDKDGKVIKSIPVTVTAAAKITNVTLGSNSITIAKDNKSDVVNAVSVKAVDQYGNDITGSTIITTEGVNGSGDAISATPNGKNVEVTTKTDAKAGNTYTVKVNVKYGNDVISRYFTVSVVDTETATTDTATDLRLEVSGVTDGKVDMAVSDTATKADDAKKDVTVKVAAYAKGAKIGYVALDQTKTSVDNDANITKTTTGASISVVSCSGVKAEKNLKAGKTYTITLVTEKGKTLKTTFAVVDTQASASIKVNDKKVSSLGSGKDGAKAVVKNNCEVTYNGVTYKGDTLNVSDVDYKTTTKDSEVTAIYVSTAQIEVNNGHISYDVTVTVNTAFTK